MLGVNDTKVLMTEFSSKRAPKNKTRHFSVAQQVKGPASDKIGSGEKDLGTPLQEADTSTKGLNKPCVSCYVWRNIDYHHNVRHRRQREQYHGGPGQQDMKPRWGA